MFNLNDPISICHRMDAKGWVANHDGNVSVRNAARQSGAPETFWATPTARAKCSLTQTDLIEIDLHGKTVQGAGKVFSEWAFHRAVYEIRPDATAVVHAHPPYAMAAGMAGLEVTTGSVPEAVVSLGGGIPLARSGGQEFATLVPHYDAVLVAGNGVFAWGPSLEVAYLRLELVEHVARALALALPLGGAQTVGPDEQRELLKKRDAVGLARPKDPLRPHWFLP